MLSGTTTLRALTLLTVIAITSPPAGGQNWSRFRLRRADKVQTLAKKLDQVQGHFEEHGSIVAKSPDVWGESRLTRNRSEVETQLRARLGTFDFRINANRFNRDAAFLAQAISLQSQIAAGDSAPDATGLVSGLQGGEDATNLVPRSGFPTTREAFGIEPVIELDQLNRYLQHLNELRRLNEGDDTADAPGYALNLIRIPISILPGRRTRTGYGAEVEISIDPHFGEDLLPLVFRDFVINGVKNRIGYEAFTIANRSDISALIDELRTYYRKPSEEGVPPGLQELSNPERFRVLGRLRAMENANSLNAFPGPFRELGDVARAKQTLADIKKVLADKKWSLSEEVSSSDFSELDDGRVADVVAVLGLGEDSKTIEEIVLPRFELGGQLPASLDYASLSPSFTRAVNGHTLRILALHIYDQLVSLPMDGTEIPEADRFRNGLTFPATEELLLAELRSAYAFLMTEAARGLWSNHCTKRLAQQIREYRANSRSTGISETRRQFFEEIETTFPEAKGSVVASLAWHIIVESALLEYRLVRDMKETASARNCPCLPTHYMRFAGPEPTPEARDAFKQYVKCRWPIHIFTLDPVTQDQNVADSSSRRRELQVAAAIAAANQGIGIGSLTQYARRLEHDLETIALNRTAVGFAHDDNTFGWRFYPRIQTPPVPGQAKAAFQTLFGRGTNADDLLRQSKLEAGMRECTALVVMPSFIPSVTVDVKTNWFKLGEIKSRWLNRRKPGFQDTMRLSREIVELRQLASMCKSDEHLYRAGEVYRLCKSVERLEKRIPLQTYSAEVPWENTLGGFEMFNTGSSTLKPKLLGWYGTPGIRVSNPNSLNEAAALVQRREGEVSEANLQLQLARARGDADDVTTRTAALAAATSQRAAAQQALDQLRDASGATRVFVIGKNFSVLDTQIIAGGVDVTNSIRLLSRTLMSIEIPPSASTTTLNRYGDQAFVPVNLMTPYGASSSRLLIPIQESSSDADAAAATAAQNAVTAHVNEAHPISYSLELPVNSLGGTAVLGPMNVTDFGLHAGGTQSLKVKNSRGEDIDRVLNATSQVGQIAFRVTVSSNNTAKTDLPLRVGPFAFAIDRDLPLSDIEPELKRVITTQLPVDFDAKELTLQPYVRFIETNGGNTPDRTIFKVDGELKVVMRSVTP